MNRSKVKNVIAWVIQILLAAGFVMAAAGKLTGNQQMVENFRNWGYPEKFYLLIGALELLGAIGLLIARTAWLAASGLIVIMLGAIATHLLHGEIPQSVFPLTFLLLLAVVLFLRRPRKAN